MSRRQRRERRDRRKQHSRPTRLRTRQSLITGATVTAGALVGFTSTAVAQDFQVTNLNDSTVGDANCLSGNCTLRQAVTAANTGGGSFDNVTFQSGLSGQITLTNGEISVTDGVYLLGPGANVLRISGNSASRILNVNMGTAGRPIGIYNLSLMYGHPATGDGGAIYNTDGLLKIASSVLSKNTAADGGAVYDKGGYNSGSSDYIVDSTFSNNYASVKGGGLYGYDSLGRIVNSTISGNHETGNLSGRGGGGVYVFAPTGFYDSTVANNDAAGTGGGIWNNGAGNVVLQNTIVADNSAGSPYADARGTFDA